MKIQRLPLLALLALTSCAPPAPVEPIPGSITYGGQPSEKLTKSPIESSLSHIFFDETGRRTEETYILQPDRSLKLVERHYIEPPF